MKGFKIRIPVMPIESSRFESLGAAPITINIKEAYSALQTRLVDGQENPLALIQTWKFYEVQKFCSLASHMWDGFWVLGNSRAFGRLPPRRRGAHPGELVAQLAASGAMSDTIPPSLVLITIGSSAGVSIAGLFTGGLLPAAVGALALVVIVRLRAGQSGEAGDRLAERAGGATMLRSAVVALPALALPFLIRAAVVDGIATATEVSTVGIAYTILAGALLYRRGSWARVYPMLVGTASLAGAILLIIGMATAMAWALTQSGFSQALVAAMTAVPGGRAGFLAVSIVAFTILGSVLEGIPAIVLLGPLLFPAARALDIHDVHYAMTAVLAMGLGLFAPPFGVGFYFSCAIGGATPDEAWGRVWPYLGALLLAVVLVAAVPWLSIGFL